VLADAAASAAKAAVDMSIVIGAARERAVVASKVRRVVRQEVVDALVTMTPL
jgi:hypothetical protein